MANFILMNAEMQITVEKVRANPPSGRWIVSETQAGYEVRCGNALLVTVNGRKPRVFRNLDTLAKKLKEEIGLTEFEVIKLKS